MSESTTAVVAALAGNGALAALKGAAAAATGSAAMLAETFHSLADTGNQILLLIGLRRAKRPADSTHPFGHGKDVYFWAFVVSMLLFSVGGAFSIWEAVSKLLHPAGEPRICRTGDRGLHAVMKALDRSLDPRRDEVAAELDADHRRVVIEPATSSQDALGEPA